MGKPKSIVKRAKDGTYYWRATGGNGEPQAHGETHLFQVGARRAWKTFLTVTCVALLEAMGYTVTPPKKEEETS